MLLQLGAKPIAHPYVITGQYCTAFYFAFIYLILPVSTLLENALLDSD
jgi:hypothetical protein